MACWQLHRQRFALPLTPRIAVWLSASRPVTPENTGPCERVFRRAWKTVARERVLEGRIEVLAQWARHRERVGDTRAATKLREAAFRALDLWQRKAPDSMDREQIAEQAGLIGLVEAEHA